MTRYLLARVVVTLVGIAVWGYGQRFEMPTWRIGGIAILAVALMMRFAPRRWFDDDRS
ncbi:MAG: hypothetical protein M3Z05_12770 [Gemmatimonadota bacterium]|nr:hypothetical protein [Gemmatimonadota bacterium]